MQNLVDLKTFYSEIARKMVNGRLLFLVLTEIRYDHMTVINILHILYSCMVTNTFCNLATNLSVHKIISCLQIIKIKNYQ